MSITSPMAGFCSSSAVSGPALFITLSRSVWRVTRSIWRAATETSTPMRQRPPRTLRSGIFQSRERASPSLGHQYARSELQRAGEHQHSIAGQLDLAGSGDGDLARAISIHRFAGGYQLTAVLPYFVSVISLANFANKHPLWFPGSPLIFFLCGCSPNTDRRIGRTPIYPKRKVVTFMM